MDRPVPRIALIRKDALLSLNTRSAQGILGVSNPASSIDPFMRTAISKVSHIESLLPLLPGPSQPLVVRYGVSALLSACSLGIFAAMEVQSGFIGLYILLPAIFLSGMLFDRGSGFFATGVAVAGVLLILRPQWPSPLTLPIILFGFIAFAFAILAEALRKEMERAVASERSKTLLLQEVAHRTKNNLAMLSAMVRLQSRTLGQEASAALETTSQRIQTMAEVYDHLMLRDQTKIVDLKEYIGDIVRRLLALSGDKPVGLRCELDEVYAHSEIAVPIAIIINELVTNSIKYGFVDDRVGQILIKLQANDDLVLTVTDNGIGLPSPEQTTKGVGSKVVALLAQQLNGTISYEPANPGCRVILRMPKPTI